MSCVTPGFIEFSRDGSGNVGFIAVEEGIDWGDASRPAGSGIEYSWEGFDEGDHVSGRGSAVIDEDGGMRGRIYFHLGDDSGFRAERHDR